jgi:hypothetical protein
MAHKKLVSLVAWKGKKASCGGVAAKIRHLQCGGKTEFDRLWDQM